MTFIGCGSVQRETKKTVKLTSQLVNNTIDKLLSQLTQDDQVNLIIPLSFAREIIKVWLAQEQAISAEDLYNILLKTRYMSPFE